MAANPPAIPADTDPDVWWRQMDAISKRSVAERMEEWEQFNKAVNLMAEQAVRRRHPDYDDRKDFLALVRAYYGDELGFEVWPEAASVER